MTYFVYIACFLCYIVVTLGATTISLDEHQQKFAPKDTDEGGKKMNAFLREMRGSSMQMTKSRDFSGLLDMLSSGTNWDHFTPPPIHNPDCAVEVQVMQKVPGRCIRLGARQVPACQTQNWVAFNSDDCKDE